MGIRTATVMVFGMIFNGNLCCAIRRNRERVSSRLAPLSREVYP